MSGGRLRNLPWWVRIFLVHVYLVVYRSVIEPDNSLWKFKSAWNVQCHRVTDICKYVLYVLSRFIVKWWFLSHCQILLLAYCHVPLGYFTNKTQEDKDGCDKVYSPCLSKVFSHLVCHILRCFTSFISAWKAIWNPSSQSKAKEKAPLLWHAAQKWLHHIISDSLITFVTITAPWSPAGLHVWDRGIQGSSCARSFPCHKI